MSSRCFIFLLAAAVSGCASTPGGEFSEISKETAVRLRSAPAFQIDVLSGKDLLHYTGKETAAVATSFVLFGLLGAGIASSAAGNIAENRGERLAHESGMNDPAQLVASKLHERMVTRNRMVTDDATCTFTSRPRIGALPKAVLVYYASLYVTSNATGKTSRKWECNYELTLIQRG